MDFKFLIDVERGLISGANYLIEGFQGSYLLRTDLDPNHRLAQILPVNISSKLDAMAAL